MGPVSYLPSDPKQLLANRVSGEGDNVGADRIVCSENTTADITDETISALQECTQLHIPSNKEFILLSHISEEEVTSAIDAFPCGSAGGPGGIRPQYLLDLTSNLAEHGGN